jgi:hypothetical protein
LNQEKSTADKNETWPDFAKQQEGAQSEYRKSVCPSMSKSAHQPWIQTESPRSMQLTRGTIPTPTSTLTANSGEKRRAPNSFSHQHGIKTPD